MHGDDAGNASPERKMRVNAKKLLSRTRRDAWRVEALEPRVLLSADPVLGGLHALLMPVGDTDATGIDAYQAYGTADLGIIAYETSAREGLVVDEEVIV